MQKMFLIVGYNYNDEHTKQFSCFLLFLIGCQYMLGMFLFCVTVDYLGLYFHTEAPLPFEILDALVVWNVSVTTDLTSHK